MATDVSLNPNNNTSPTEWTEAIAVEKFMEDVVYAIICQGMNYQNFKFIIFYHFTLDHIDIIASSFTKILTSIPLSVKTGYLCGLQKGPTTVI